MAHPQIAHYQLQARLGQGAMGVVFRARDTRLERDVALKLLQVSLDTAEAADYAARLLQEARSAARLNHPGIITVYDCGEWRGKSYLAMELVQGRTLKALLEERGALPVKEVQAIARQMFAALAHAHSHDVVHRDIKPANLMITGEGRLKITDFGIAQLPASDLTRTGTVLGSPRYMSPEQLAGKKLDGRADLYSAGVVLYQALTAKLPFDGETTMNIVYQVLHTTPEAPHLLDPAIPEWLSLLVMRCMGRTPEERFADAAEALATLQAGPAGLPESRKAAFDAPTETVNTAAFAQAAQAQTTPRQRAAAPDAATQPVSAWLAQTLVLLGWLARWAGRILARIARELGPLLCKLGQQLQHWAPIVSARIAAACRAAQPHIRQGWLRFRALPNPAQAGIALVLVGMLAWAAWPKAGRPEVRLSPPAAVVEPAPQPPAQANEAQARSDQAENSDNADPTPQPRRWDERGMPIEPAKQDAQIANPGGEAQPEQSARTEKNSGSGSVKQDIKHAGREVGHAVRGLFRCIAGKAACPTSAPDRSADDR